MSSSEGALPAAPSHRARRARPCTLAIGRYWPEPLALALLAELLNFWDLSRNGWANTYWAWCRPSRTAVDGAPLDRSPAGQASIALDRPPVGDVSLARPRRARARADVRARRSLFAGAAAMLLIGGAWPLLVELTPAANRPWISSTADNAVLSLIFGYNGLGRIEGQSGGPQALGGSNLFGGSTGPLRLFNEALGGQAGGLLGFALISGVAVLLACRLRRTDPRSAWLLVVGGALLTTAAVFSFAHGIFHPTALRWLTPTLLVLGALAVTLLLVGAPHLRLAALTGALALLLLAPATWAVETLGHATSGTFPAGGPASNPASGFGGGPGAPGGAHGAFPGARPGFAGGPPGAATPGNPSQAGPTAGRPPLFGNDISSTRSPSRAEPGAAAAGGPVAAAAAGLGDTRGDARPTGRLATPGAGFGSSLAPGVAGHSGAGIFGATSRSLTAAVRYANTHGGGTVAVASQSEAASLVIDGEHVAGIGGFSGRESETNAAWLAQEVRSGHIRWVLTTSSGAGGGPGGRDQRVGATRAMAAVTASCKRISAVSGLYDCAARAAKLAATTTTTQTGTTGATRSR